ncbi:hypothetical protein [uncultured Maritimibacter sp.]|uniref:hypothetical protein n=1 Tax=uncultured Maritimibacter sp. TaxID=991866 RepID=UPI00259A3A8F|nr:hypothetical protein [uncultured Maritimibacter sp.]
MTIRDVAAELGLSRAYVAGLFCVCRPDEMNTKRLKLRNKWGEIGYAVDEICDWLEQIGNPSIVTEKVIASLKTRARENSTQEMEFISNV